MRKLNIKTNKSKKTKKYFAGGPIQTDAKTFGLTNTSDPLGGSISGLASTLGLNNNVSNTVGGVTDLAQGIVTGNPMALIQGAGSLFKGVSGFLQKSPTHATKEQMQTRDALFGKQQMFANGGDTNSSNSKNIDTKNYGIEWKNFYNVQPYYTRALAEKYPNIPIKDILSRSLEDKNFSNAQLNQYADSLVNKYGDFHLNPTEMDSVANKAGMDIRDIERVLSAYDTELAGNKANITGTKEQGQPVNDLQFGPRMMLHRRFEKGNIPYKYLNNKFEDGGNLTEFNEGGTHEQNPNGGIPQGYSPNGDMNTVEQGETKNGNYVFSDRRIVSENDAKQFNLPKITVGKTFAKASKLLNKYNKERPYDPISNNSSKEMLGRLEEASESTMPDKNEGQEQFADGGNMPFGYTNSYIYNMFHPNNNQYSLEQNNMNYIPDIKVKSLANPLDNNLFRTDTVGLNTMTPKEVSLSTDNSLMPMNADTSSGLALADNNTNSGGNGFLSNLGQSIADNPMSLLRYAPIAANILGIDKPKQAPTVSLPMSSARYTPGYMDVEQMISPIASQREQTIGDIMNTSGGSASSARAGILGADVNYGKAVSDAINKINQYNLGQDAAAQSFNAQQDQFNISQMTNQQQINAQNLAAYNNAKSVRTQGLLQDLTGVGQEAYYKPIIEKTFGYSPTGKVAKKNGGKIKKFKMIR